MLEHFESTQHKLIVRELMCREFPLPDLLLDVLNAFGCNIQLPVLPSVCEMIPRAGDAYRS